MAENIVPDTNINIPEKVLQVVNRSNDPRRNKDVKMLKVPPLLRLEKYNQQEYDPLVVSIGPYHHGKEELQLAEEIKITTLQLLVDESGKDAKLFYEEVLKRVNDARKCYIDGSTDQYDDPNFAQMMLLDACFIVNYIVNGENLGKALGELPSAYIIRDLLLLENQIPFWLLKMLILSGYGEKQWKEIPLVSIINEEEPVHLLHAVWLSLVSVDSSFHITPLDQHSKLGKFRKNCFNLLKSVTGFPRQWCKFGDENEDNSVHSFRSASELKTRGIHFRSSSGNTLQCFKLNPGNLFSTLEVPRCYITMYTKSFYLNMIAYELCLSKSTDRIFTAYIAFMKVLVDNPKDVKELREKNILVTMLGNDEDVVKFFKELNTYGLDYVNIFQNVKVDIQAHYNNKVKKWIGELLYTYFRSPWTAITLFAATILLLLTFIQTYFTINPWNG